jgi:mannose-6-phosphate isomerase-like protein (cupin superfamily)
MATTTATTVKAWRRDKWETVGKAKCRVDGNGMEIAIPRAMIGQATKLRRLISTGPIISRASKGHGNSASMVLIMKGRSFLRFPLVAAALAMGAKAADPDRRGTGFKVSSGAGRYAEELLIMGGRFDCKVCGKDTNGDLCIYDTNRDANGGPALHRHYYQDEWFYVIRGELIVKVGDATFELHPGDSAFGPRRIPHAFARISEGDDRLLVLFQPAGTIEEFFREISKHGKRIPGHQEIVLKKLWEQHGMEIGATASDLIAESGNYFRGIAGGLRKAFEDGGNFLAEAFNCSTRMFTDNY